MRKIIVIILAGLTVAGFGGFLISVWQNRQASMKAVAVISESLNTYEQIEAMAQKSQLLAEAQLESMPGLLAAITRDFGDLAKAGSFYLLPDSVVAAFQLGSLPGSGAGKGKFILQVPSGAVYYAGYPMPMSAAEGQNISYQIQANEDGRVNPFKGWAPWSKNLPIQALEYTMAHANVYWSDLEPEEGVVDFTGFEEKNQVAYCRAQNIRLIIRVIMDYPNKENEMQLPGWLYEKISGDGTWYAGDESHQGFCPNYENPILLAAHERLMAALGQRYNQDPVIAFVQLGSLGHYGEWNVDTEAGSMPSPAVTARYVSHYASAFPDKCFMFRRPVTQMAGLRAGLYNDMIGDTIQTNRWLNWITAGGDEEFPDMAAIPDFWQNGPSGGEFGYGDPYRYLADDACAETIRQVTASHTSIIGPNTPTKFTSSSQADNARLIQDHLGYRFSLHSVTFPRTANAGTTITLWQQWENSGNSPMYYAWPVQMRLLDAQGQVKGSWQIETDLRQWLPGSIHLAPRLTLPADLSPGTYTWMVAILDPATGRPGIVLANEGKTADGYYGMRPDYDHSS